MFDLLFNPLPYDKEIYDIAYNSKSMTEAFKIADDYTKKIGQSFIIGLALSQASIRLKTNNEKLDKS